MARRAACALGPSQSPSSTTSCWRRSPSSASACRIHGRPNEVADPIPFREDRGHAAYDPDYAQRFWRVLLQADRVFKQFRTRFLGKVSPVHFFWGSFDHAVTRFSGRKAPPHPGGVPNLPDAVTREAYSHEVSSAGFWPGGGAVDYPAFYSYAYPTPAGFAAAPVRPEAAFFHEQLGEFILPYDAVRIARAPDTMLLDFLQTTYEAAANAANPSTTAARLPVISRIRKRSRAASPGRRGGRARAAHRRAAAGSSSSPFV